VSLSFSLLFPWFAAFLAIYWFYGFSFFSMTFFSFSLAFGLLVIIHVVLDSKFKLCAFVLSMYSSWGD
jgi:hypothetical protein